MHKVNALCRDLLSFTKSRENIYFPQNQSKLIYIDFYVHLRERAQLCGPFYTCSE